ncbi:glycine--tRNA ligase [Candidatus Parcubacteria bacterium]|nr:glycine--tRNA ligase [Candidatus Parcubacteria bacterium]
MSESENVMEKIVSLSKRRGFVYQGSEIYGGLAGTWDYGPLGVALKKNIENLWWKRFVLDREDMYGVDAAILMHPKVWEASGHVAGFSDPLVTCQKCKRRFRADHVGEKCPECEGSFTKAQQFNMMFKTHVGAAEDESSVSYLRPETAGGMFVNFKNIIDSFHPKLPFGMAQIGKAFRNEIAPRDFIFRVRELEQMEIEYFVRPDDWRTHFDYFFDQQMDFLKDLGLSQNKIHKIDVPAEDRAHYSKHSVDTEFDFPFGQKELLGLAYRTDHDLSAHTNASSVDLSYFDEETKERFTPHVIEPTFGLGRLFLAVLSDAYMEEDLGEEKRVFLKFKPSVAPVKAAVFPLLKNKPDLVTKAREVYQTLKQTVPQIMWDDNGNIGKRYRRQDEIGTPYCITIDFDTLGEVPENKDTVTVRDRDSGEQQRMAIADLPEFLQTKIKA